MRSSDELLKKDQEFSDYSKDQGVVKAFEEYLAENATLLPNNNLPIVGKDKILEFLASGGTNEMVWSPEFATVSDSNNLGYSWGNWTMAVKDSNGNIISTEKGKYSNCWVKVLGEWKVLFDMSNMNPSKQR